MTDSTALSQTESHPGQTRRKRRFLRRLPLRVWIATISLACFLTSFAAVLFAISFESPSAQWAPLQTMELYFAAAGALLVVTAFRSVDGPIKLKVAGVFEFDGAGGPIVMWILVFLSLCFGMHLLGFDSQAQSVAHWRTG